MPGVRVTINQAKLHSLLTASHQGVGRFMLTLGNRVVNNAKARANVKTGRMRASIQMGALENASGDNIRVRVGTDVSYALYVHEGHHSYPGNPFLRDALVDEVSRL